MFVNSLTLFVVLYLTIQTSQGTQCLYGTDLPLPTDSNQVIQCGEHQSCYLDAVVTINGGLRYYAGCREKLFCTDTSNSNDEISNDEIQTSIYNKRDGEIVVCSQCCNGTLCNSKGCHNPGYQTQRGPICMSCKDQLTPTDCYMISECGRGEVCMLLTFLHPSTHQKRFQTKCELAERCERDVKQHLEIRNRYQLIGRKRQTNELLTEQDVACDISCCTDDLCNGNCTALKQQQLTTTEPLTATSSITVPTKTTPSLTTSSTSAPTTVSPSTSTPTSTIQTKPPTTSTTTKQSTTTEALMVHCLSNPCFRGQCMEYHDTFYCKCPDGYIGRQCEENIFAQTTKTMSTTTATPTALFTSKPTTTKTTALPLTTKAIPTTATSKSTTKTTPVPMTSSPVPTTSTPVPTTTTPVPMTTTSVPVKSTPVPTTSTPVPATSTPVPMTSSPVQMTTTIMHNPCTYLPCVHGTCIEGPICKCDVGYMGQACDIEVRTPNPTTELTTASGTRDFCHSEPCVWGSCFNIVNGYICECEKGYTGLNCDQKITTHEGSSSKSNDTSSTSTSSSNSTSSSSLSGGSNYVVCSGTSCTSSTSGGTSCVTTASGGISCYSSTSGRNEGSSSPVSTSTSTSTCKGAENVTFVSIGNGPSYHISAHNHPHVTHSEAIQKCADYCSRLLRIDNADKLHLVGQFMKHDMLDFFQRTYWIDGEWKQNSWQSSYDTKRSKRFFMLAHPNVAIGKCASLKFGGIHATLESIFCHIGHGFICERK